MADALTALDEISVELAALTSAVTRGRSKQIPSGVVQPMARAIAKSYFELVRPELLAIQNRAGLVEEIDFVVQSVLQLAEAQREKQAYIGQLNELRPYLREASVDLMKAKGTPRVVLSATEQNILDTLAAMIPGGAASYEQVLRDLAHGGRVSWRGTAAELREVLRDVIDQLAPDDKVMGAQGFQLVDEQTRPTQKQKVRFILRARRTGSAGVGTAEGSLDAIDEAVATLARSTYQRGAVSTHVATTGKEVRSLKRYVDALLAELLEVS